MSGFFITFEGGEGSGKSTQIARLAERLRRNGMNVVTTREPGGSEGAEAVRHVILSGAAKSEDGELETILFAAARADHVNEVIRPAIYQGCIVVCDRFHDSTRVYQGLAGADGETIAILEEIALNGTRPDLTIVLDVPARLGLERAGARRGDDQPDRFESEELAIHEARRASFLELAQLEPQRCVVVDGSRSIEDVAAEIAFIVEDRLDNRRLENGDLRARPAGEQSSLR